MEVENDGKIWKMVLGPEDWFPFRSREYHPPTKLKMLKWNSPPPPPLTMANSAKWHVSLREALHVGISSCNNAQQVLQNQLHIWRKCLRFWRIHLKVLGSTTDKHDDLRKKWHMIPG